MDVCIYLYVYICIELCLRPWHCVNGILLEIRFERRSTLRQSKLSFCPYINDIGINRSFPLVYIYRWYESPTALCGHFSEYIRLKCDAGIEKCPYWCIYRKCNTFTEGISTGDYFQMVAWFRLWLPTISIPSELQWALIYPFLNDNLYLLFHVLSITGTTTISWHVAFLTYIYIDIMQILFKWILQWYFVIPTVSLRLMTSRVKGIGNYSQKTVKCNFVMYGFKPSCEISMVSFEFSPKMAIKILTSYGISEL